MVTISDVAKKAKVSRSTVSRVLNNQMHHVREETRQAVLNAARELDYRPNSIARSLKTKKSHCIGVITDDIDTPFLPSMLKAIEQYAFSRGYNSLVCNTGYESDRQETYVEMLAQRQIDGIIFAASFVYSYTQELINPGLPIVYAYSHSPHDNKNSVLADDVHAAEQVVDHLVNLGHRRIGYVNGPEGVIPSQERIKGYREALKKHEIPFDDKLVIHGEWEDPQSGYRAAKRFLELKNPPTAIFAANDIMAAGAIDAASDLGLKVPGDISVIGYDDRDIARFLKPALTTVRLPMAEIGSAAAKMLIDCLEYGEALTDSMYVPCELVVRKSCSSIDNK
ncbi:MAG TPA: LacI family DNA-binding transcriptional regulator [Limnochordia bacterium]|jgi:DNA-binding LacI/PurR family transcriptional regulator|nr:LacI family DNA-binding transcriptional regulator [Limnochordia bacterium]